MATYSQIEIDIIDSFKKLMSDHEFSNISISEIASGANITRRGFYNHFKDKYDLVNTIFDNDVFPKVIKLTDVDNWYKGSIYICNYLKENHEYYKKLVGYNGQNCLQKEFHHLTEMQLSKLIPEILDGRQISNEDRSFLIEYYYNAYMGIMTEWVLQKSDFTSEEIVMRWKILLENSLHNYLNSFAK
ncbi:TetR-like C-terminal domain-containing protein [Companilactobacillus tucceti]|nr:TetR-like C-terminal domain-containing protein [Companilactobacillus tucceti]